jgi:hypothetical protein
MTGHEVTFTVCHGPQREPITRLPTRATAGTTTASSTLARSLPSNTEPTRIE